VERGMEKYGYGAIMLVAVKPVYWFVKLLDQPVYLCDELERQPFLPQSLQEQLIPHGMYFDVRVTFRGDAEVTDTEDQDQMRFGFEDVMPTPIAPVVSLTLADCSLQMAMETLSSISRIKIVFDDHELEAAGTDLQKPISVDVHEQPISCALESILYPVSLAFDVRNADTVQIVSQPPGFKEWKARELVKRVSRELGCGWNEEVVRSAFLAATLDPNNKLARDAAQSARVIQRISDTERKHSAESHDGDNELTYKVYDVAELVAPDLDKGRAQRLSELVAWITRELHPDTWVQAGGFGTIDFYPLGKQLIIKQRANVHDDIGKALARVRDQE
jgi:hypothetical protein